MENKKFKTFKTFAAFGKFTWVGKVFLVGGVFAVAGLLYLFIAGGGSGSGVGNWVGGDNGSSSSADIDGSGTGPGGSGGILSNILKTGSAIALKSWNQVFGGSGLAPSVAQDGASDEVGLSVESSTVATSSMSQADDNDGGIGDGDVDDTSAGVAAGDVSQTPAPTAKAKKTAKVVPQFCSFGNATAGAAVGAGVNTNDGIILNEVAWMGSVAQDGETGAKASEREWIELKNISAAPVDVSGWQVLDAAGNLKVILGGAAGDAGVVGSGSSDATIPAGGFYLLVRDDGSLLGAQTDAGYSGSLPNTGDQLAVFDANCGASDFLDASAGWPAGNNMTKQTMERDAGAAGATGASADLGWHTSAEPGGTPRAENSVPVATSTAPTSTSMSPPIVISTINNKAPVVAVSTSSVPVPAPVAVPQYLISVSAIGDGNGTVSDAPSGILCGFTCEASYAAGTKISFAETPAAGSFFKGWSGACKNAGAGTGVAVGACSFTVSGSVSVVAEFDAVPPASLITTLPTSTMASSLDSDNQSSSDTPSSSANTATASHLLIAAIQIAGASTSNDFVKIFNPTSAVVDISGWKLHKKSSTGTDASLRTLPTESSIAPGGYFVWANSVNGFSETIAADVSSTETLSADNSVALFDVAGNIIDQVAWGTGANQYVEGSAYPTDPTANQVLARKSAMIDTDNNAADFAIQ